MKISIVTPSYNAARTIEQTIESVLAQDLPELEYIVMDGGSTDGTKQIIEKFGQRLAHWTSEPDRGQVDALNKGFALATGEVLGFLNADDVLLPGALRAVIDGFTHSREVDLVCGQVEWIDAEGRVLGHHAGRIETLSDVLEIYRVWWREQQWVQPEVFFRRSLKHAVGAFDDRYDLAFDYDFWVRCFLAGARVAHIPQRLAQFRLHDAQKSTASRQAADEIRTIVRRHLDTDPPISKWRRLRLEAQLAYDLYQLGEPAESSGRSTFLRSFLRHPEWLLSPEARNRAQAACRRQLWGSKRSHP